MKIRKEVRAAGGTREGWRADGDRRNEGTPPGCNEEPSQADKGKRKGRDKRQARPGERAN